MASRIWHLARWLAWQVSDHTHPDAPGAAQITVFSAEEPGLTGA